MSDDYQTGSDGKEIALEARALEGERLFSPSAARNRDFIRDTYLSLMPKTGKILEVGSGSGEHGVHIASALPDINWHSGDPDFNSRCSISAWISHASLENMKSPHSIDVISDHWGEIETSKFDGLVSINMIHIAPFEAAKGLFAGAGRLLQSGGKLFLYGPFSRNGKHISPSNADFNASLRGRDPSWGVRDLENDIMPLAKDAGLDLDQIVDMPANNFVVTFDRP